MTQLTATRARLSRTDSKMLVINEQKISHMTLDALPELIAANSLIVVNNAATLPACLWGRINSISVEIRLVANEKPSIRNIRYWQALIFEGGSWRQRTEDRQTPASLEIGDIIQFDQITAKITDISASSNRWISIAFQGSLSEIWQELYQSGNPIQYSHLQNDLHLWDVQTIFSSIPVAVEPPSASYQFSWSLINQLRQRGADLVALTHATSVSSTGIASLDEKLPFPEYYWIDTEVATEINSATNEGRPILAIGTSVTRALEHNMTKFRQIRSGVFQADLRIEPEYDRKIVTELFTGLHLAGESHIQLLHNFIEPPQLSQAYREAEALDYLWHEYGDVCYIR